MIGQRLKRDLFFGIHQLICIALPALLLPTAAAQLPPVPEKGDPQQSAVPELYVEQRVVDIGEVIEGDNPTVSWILENRGNADLIIERARASCGCTVVRLKEEEKVIRPGESLALKVEFRTLGRDAAQSKSISVFSNDPVTPIVKLELVAKIKTLYRIVPSGLVNLRAIRRGGTAAKTIEIHPGSGGQPIEVLDIRVPEGVPFRFAHEPFDTNGSTGQRIRVSVDRYASLGTITTKATLKVRVGNVEQERIVAIRGAVVGDVTWTPQVVDNTRHPSRGGTQFSPVTIRSAEGLPFKILEAEAGPRFDVAFEPISKPSKATRYSVLLTLRDDAPPGPFGTTLLVRTDSLDQPLIKVPVFGIVAAPIEVEPPVIILRQDATAVGTQRRVKLQVLPQMSLEVTQIECDNPAVKATIDRAAGARYHHIRFLDVTLIGKLAVGSHRVTLKLTTNVKRAEELEIPVIIEVPEA